MYTHTHNGVLFSLKKEVNLTHVATWMNPGDTMLTEIIQPLKINTYDFTNMKNLELIGTKTQMVISKDWREEDGEEVFDRYTVSVSQVGDG